MEKCLRKNLFSLIQVAIFMLCVNSACVAAVVEFTDEATFRDETGTPQYFIDFESYGNGDPVPQVGEPVMGVPISGNEWLDDFGIQFAEMESGFENLLFLSEKEGMNVSEPPTLGHALATAGLSPGNDRTSRLITFSTPVISFGVYVVDNETTSLTERITLKDVGGNVLGDFAMPVGPSLSQDFRGYSSTIPIAEILLIEANDNEGMALDNVMYTTPEPTTLLLFGLGGLALRRKRRVK